MDDVKCNGRLMCLSEESARHMSRLSKSKQEKKAVSTMIYLRKVWHKLRYSHSLRLFFDAISKIGIRFTPYYVVLEGLFGETIPIFEKGFSEYELGFLGPDDMKDVAAMPGRGIAQETLVQRLEKGQLCYGVKYGGKPVSFNWFDLGEFSFDRHRFPMKDSEAYLFDAHTHMDFRGKQLAPYVRYQSYKELARMGRTRLYSASDYFNTPSIKFKKKLKAKLTELHLLIILFRKWHFRLPLSKSKG